MDLFRLTYTVASAKTTTPFDASRHFEVYGSAQTIFDLWFHLRALERLALAGQHPSACPRFLEIRNNDGVVQHPDSGLAALSNVNTFS